MNINFQNISPDWTGSTPEEQAIMTELVAMEATPQAIVYFARKCDRLSDYWYWFGLGTLWVSYSGWSDLNLWKRLFKSQRANRSTSLMKPDEYSAFEQLAKRVTVYRAHRENETDWISYTLDPHIAARFAVERGVNEIKEYSVPSAAVLALFTRRGEAEVLVLNRHRAKYLDTIPVANSDKYGELMHV